MAKHDDDQCDIDDARFALADVTEKSRTSATAASPLSALLGLLEFAKNIVVGIARILSGLYDSAILVRPESFMLVAKSSSATLTPGAAGTKVAFNDGSVPMMVRVQGPVNAAMGTASFLYGDQNANDATAADASVIAFAVGPVIAVVLPPSRTLHINGTNPDGSTDAFQVKVSVVPLRGRAAIFTRG